jgi:hypothetical protein
MTLFLWKFMISTVMFTFIRESTSMAPRHFAFLKYCTLRQHPERFGS